VVLRQCNGCQAALRPATVAEITAQRDRRPLPDVRPACPVCAPTATREDLAVLAAAHIAVRTGAVVDMPLDVVERAAGLAVDLAAALRDIAEARDGGAR
jgi:hypothetical protein